MFHILWTDKVDSNLDTVRKITDLETITSQISKSEMARKAVIPDAHNPPE